MNPYITYFILALIFQMQNLVFSLFGNFIFVPNMLEFFFIYVSILLISKTQYTKSIFLLWQALYLIHFSFISFFGRVMQYSDIYLFFTHLGDTYETFVATMNLYILPLSISIVISSMVLLFDFKRVRMNPYILLVLFVLGVFFLPTIPQDSSLSLIKSVMNPKLLHRDTKEIKSGKKLTAMRKASLNIVLVIGESMRAKEYHIKRYEIFQKHTYKTIYAGATSTDVSVPLLINGAIKPSNIDMAKNIFTLAKQNNIETSFISVQSKKSMKYIKPFLSIQDINNYKIVASRDDKELLNELKNINFKEKINLVVMQMQGEHSPYKYYPSYNRNSNIITRYAHSMDYSNKILLQMMVYMKGIDSQSIFIFTSDHGELLGEAGRYGHNTFKEEVYKVPFIYENNFESSKRVPPNIESHYDIYTLIFHLLGYEQERTSLRKKIRVNGTMISEEDGYKIFDIIAK